MSKEGGVDNRIILPRRDLILGAAALASSYFFRRVPVVFAADERSPKTEAEKQLGVRLLTVNGSNVPAAGMICRDLQEASCDTLPKRWNNTQVGIIRDGLDMMGSAICPKDQNIEIVLSNNNFVPTETLPHRVYVDFRYLNPDDAAIAKAFLLHELIHIKNKWTVTSPFPYEHLTSPWFDKVYEILGGSFDKPPANDGYKKAAPLINQFGYATYRKPENMSVEEHQDYLFYFEMDYAFRIKYPVELIAVLATQNLTQGESRWREKIKEYMSPEQADRLSGFIKDDVLGGREFKTPLNSSP